MGEEGIGLVQGKWEFKIPRMTLYGRSRFVTLKMEAVHSSEKLQHVYYIALKYSPPPKKKKKKLINKTLHIYTVQLLENFVC
jgi:hypothetical protein